MRGISIKALVLSNLSSFVILAAAGIVGYVASPFLAQPFTQASLTDIQRDLVSSALWMQWIVALSVIAAAVGSGYIAAVISRTNPLLNGALSSLAMPLISLAWYAYGLLHVSVSGAGHHGSIITTVLEYCAPAMGVFGAYISQIVKREQSRVASDGQEGTNANWYIGLRWVSAFLAAGAGFCLADLFFWFIYKVTGLDDLIGLLSAVYAGCLLGVYVAPSGHRKAACVVFAMLPILVSIGDVGRYAALGTLRHPEGLAMLLFGGMGSAVAFYFFKRHDFRSALE
jgi:hypothetical protein